MREYQQPDALNNVEQRRPVANPDLWIVKIVVFGEFYRWCWHPGRDIVPEKKSRDKVGRLVRVVRETAGVGSA